MNCILINTQSYSGKWTDNDYIANAAKIAKELRGNLKRKFAYVIPVKRYGFVVWFKMEEDINQVFNQTNINIIMSLITSIFRDAILEIKNMDTLDINKLGDVIEVYVSVWHSEK